MASKIFTRFLPAMFFILLGTFLICNAGVQDAQNTATAHAPSPSATQLRHKISEVSIYYFFTLGLGLLLGGIIILAITCIQCSKNGEEEISQERNVQWSTEEKIAILIFGVVDFVFFVVAGVLGTIWGSKLLQQPHASEMWYARVVTATGLSLCTGLPICAWFVLYIYVTEVRRPSQIAPGEHEQNNLQV